MIAAATRSGDAMHGWQIVARGAETIAQLKGKRVLVPSVGGRESDFVLNVLLGGEVGKDFFSKIEAAPDTASTLAALGLGKADAAVVPASVELPGGVTRLNPTSTLARARRRARRVAKYTHPDGSVKQARGQSGTSTRWTRRLEKLSLSEALVVG